MINDGESISKYPVLSKLTFHRTASYQWSTVLYVSSENFHTIQITSVQCPLTRRRTSQYHPWSISLTSLIWVYQRFPRYRSSAEQYYFPSSFLKLELELISFTLVRESYRSRIARNDWLDLLLSHLFSIHYLKNIRDHESGYHRHSKTTLSSSYYLLSLRRVNLYFFK